MTRSLRQLDAVQIASPCSAKWEDMVGDDVVRFCGHCERNVYNLSAMEPGNAEAFLAQSEASAAPPCVRLYRRADGTVMTADCPVGVRTRRRRRTLAAFGASFLAATAGVASMPSGSGIAPLQGELAPLSPTMGTVATPVAPAPAPVETGKPIEPIPTMKPPVAVPPPPHVMGRIKWEMGAPPPRPNGAR